MGRGGDLAALIGTLATIGLVLVVAIALRSGALSPRNDPTAPPSAVVAAVQSLDVATAVPTVESPPIAATPTPSPSHAAPSPTPAPTKRPKPRPTPKPVYEGPPTAKPGTTSVPTPLADIIVTGPLGSTLHGGGFTARLTFVAWGAPDGNGCQPDGWVAATYTLTTTYPATSIRPPHVLEPAGTGGCWMTDSDTQFEVSGQTYTYIIPQRAGSNDVDLIYEYPPGTTVAFRFR